MWRSSSPRGNRLQATISVRSSSKKWRSMWTAQSWNAIRHTAVRAPRQRCTIRSQRIIYSMALGKEVLAVRIVTCFLMGITSGLILRYAYKGKPFFNFEGFEERKSRDTDPNLFLRLLKNIGRNFRATGLYFFCSACCFRRCFSDMFRQRTSQGCSARSMRASSAYGGNDWRTALCLRRRNDTPVTAMALFRNEHRLGGFVYADRTVNKDHQSRRTENRAWRKDICTVYRLCDAVFTALRVCGQSDFLGDVCAITLEKQSLSWVLD